MDANNIQAEAKELADKLASVDHTDLTFAVNQYFEDNAELRTVTLDVHGASKIKKIVWLNSLLRADGEVVGNPRYDSKHQHLAFQISHTFTSPRLPAYIPFHAHLSGIKSRPTKFNYVAHLAPNNDEQGDGGVKGQKLFVTKLEMKPVEKALVEYVVYFVLAAVAAVWTALWDTLIAESSKRQAQAEQWREKTAPQLKQLYDQALSTASKVQADLEARTKSAGIPLDDYKQRAAQLYSDLSDNVEARAKAAGVPVDEYKKQAQALLEDLKKRAAAAGQDIQNQSGKVVEEAKKRGEEGKKKVEKATNGNQTSQDGEANGNNHDIAHGSGDDKNGHDGFTTNTDGPAKSHEEIEAEFRKVPHTPLGGHDPTAPNAPSFAAAAQL